MEGRRRGRHETEMGILIGEQVVEARTVARPVLSATTICERLPLKPVKHQKDAGHGPA
jgi:hypothetical protein